MHSNWHSHHNMPLSFILLFINNNKKHRINHVARATLEPKTKTLSTPFKSIGLKLNCIGFLQSAINGLGELFHIHTFAIRIITFRMRAYSNQLRVNVVRHKVPTKQLIASNRISNEWRWAILKRYAIKLRTEWQVVCDSSVWLMD